jgi:hypothetical protein
VFTALWFVCPTLKSPSTTARRADWRRVRQSRESIMREDQTDPATLVGSDMRHLLWLRDQLPDRVVDLMVVTTGATAYRRPDGVAVVPLALLGD